MLLISSTVIFVTAQIISFAYFCRCEYFQDCRKDFSQMTLCCNSAGAERICASFPNKSHTVMRSISSWKEQPIVISKSMNRHSKWGWTQVISENGRSPEQVFENICKQMPLGIFKTTYRSPCIHRFLWKQEPDCQCSFENLITPLLQIWSPNMLLRATKTSFSFTKCS